MSRFAMLPALLPLVAAIPTFHIDLDLPPEQRWFEVTERFREEGLAMLAKLRSNLHTRFTQEEVDDWVAALKTQKPEEEEFKAELSGIAKQLDPAKQAEMYDLLLLFNAVYELQATLGCSGILAADLNGTVIHGRNLDFRFLYEVDGGQHDWPDLTLNTVFWRGRENLLESTNFAFFTGVHTAMRFGGWSFEQNTRPSNNHSENLEELKQGGRVFGWTMRSYMQEIPSFEAALERIQKTHWAAPQYFILAGSGPFEGAVITQDRGKLQPSTPPVRRLRQDTWHLLQTNDDSNKPAGDARRPLGEMALRVQKQEDVGHSWMWRNILSPSLHNSQTVFTWVAVPKTGYWSASLRNESTILAQDLRRPKIAGATKWARRALLAGEQRRGTV